MFSRTLLASAFGLLLSLPAALAQVHTDCQPLNTTCPADPAFGMDYNFVFNATPSTDAWETTAGTVSYTKDKGAIFTINKHGDSPTIRTKFYFFFGRTEVWLKTAPGTGIISSVMMLSDDLDEIDWEFFGGNNTSAESNFFGKGHSEIYTNAHYFNVDGVQDDYHNYTTTWTKDSLDWYIDGNHVRQLLPKDANNTYLYPQTPMRLSIGIWAGGDPSLPKGTRDWAGGDTDFSKGPFNMYVKSAQITDYSQGKEYSYGDNTGSWESIKITTGNSTAKTSITAPPPETLAEKWNNLSPTAHTAIYASAAGLGGALFFFALYYCIKQRRRGAREAKIAEAKAEEERLELERFRKAGIDPDSFADHAADYDAAAMRKEGLAHRDSYSVPATPVSPSGTAGIGAAAGAGAMPGRGPMRPGNNAWEAQALGNDNMHGNMRSPVPLLRDGSQSPRVASPGNPNFGYANPNMPSQMSNQMNGHMQAPPALVSPLRSPSPGAPPRFPPPASPNRSASTPNTYMRVASPGPAQAYGVPRMASPAQMNPPTRSFTAPRAPQGDQGGYDNGYHGGGGNQEYWNQGGFR